MGTWGTGILQNDTTADIWTEFKDLYNDGLSSKEVRIAIEKEYKPQTTTEYYSEIWTGIAYGQWMCGEIENYTLDKLNDATNSKWQSLWSEDKKELAKRIKAIENFIQKIQIPRPNPIKRKKIVKRRAFFQIGDIIGIKINQNYIAAIVSNRQDYANDGENTIIFTDHIFNDQTTIEAVLNSNVLYLDIGGVNNYYKGYYKAIFSAKNMAKFVTNIIFIGNIETTDFLWLKIGIPYGDWPKIGTMVDEQLKHLINNRTDRPINVSVKQFLSRNKDLDNVLIDWSKKIRSEKLNSNS